MIRNYLLKLTLVILIFFGTNNRLFSQYADLGTGALKDKIWWVDWSGFSMANGATKTFTTTNGLTVTLSFSNVSGPVMSPSPMNTWYGAVLHLLYDFSNPAILPALYHTSYQTAITNFTLTVSASRNGLTVPIQFIAADAEASAVTEITTLKTNGSNWNTVDFFRNSSQTSNPLSGCNTGTLKITDTYGNSPQTGQNPVVSTQTPANGTLVINASLDHSGIIGQMGLAFGILEAVDRGDLPASYGYAQHRIQYTYSNVCNYLPPLPGSMQDANLKLGLLPGDADGIQTLDDNSNGVDEDAVSTFPTYYGNGSYSLVLPVTNTTGSTAFLSGWFDVNGNGVFDNGELQTATIPNNATVTTLTWTGLPASLSKTTPYGFRFRLSTDASAVQSATGYAKDGEVEDYLVSVPQNVVVGFIAPDTVCVNTPVNIVNTSAGASSYYWNFCAANVNAAPVGINMGNVGNSLNAPVYIDYVFDGGNYYGFLTNNYPGGLVRLDFGTSLLNTPAVTNLGMVGGVVPGNTEGLQVLKSEGKWYVIVVGSDPANGNLSRIVKVELGVSIANNFPIGTNWGNIGSLAYPHDLYVFDDGGHWYGLTVNTATNTITRFDFTPSFSNTPTAVNLGNIGMLDGPTGIHALKENTSWYAFVTNATGNTLTRLDFGTSLLTVPAGANLGNVGGLLHNPSDVYVMKYCGENHIFVTNAQSNELVRLDLAGSLTAIPTGTSYGNVGNLNAPQCLSKFFRVGPDLFTFITNVNNNTLTRVKFSGCINSSMPNSTLQTPTLLAYNAPGIYNINLTVDDGLPTQAAFCKQVVVVSSIHTPLQIKSLCQGDSVQLTSSLSSGNQWNTGSTAQSIYVKTAGTYWVQSSNGGCINIDSFAVSVKPTPVVKLGKDTSLCTADTLLLDAGNQGATYVWQNGQTTQTFTVKQSGLYSVAVTNNGCSKKDSLLVTRLASPLVNPSPDTAICKKSSATLMANGGGTYSWSPATGLSNPASASTIAMPDSTTKYYVTVTGTNNCKARDSVTITVVPVPLVNLGKDSSLCTLDSLLLDAGNPGANYVWQNGQTTQTLLAKTAGVYSVIVNNNGCIAKDTIVLSPLTSPSITLSGNASICHTASTVLTASGGNTYQWWPTTGLSDSTGSAIIATPAVTTTYYLLASSSDNCKAKDSVTITVIPLPLFSAQASKPVLCIGDTATLWAHGGDSFAWYPAQTLSNPYDSLTQAFPLTTTAYQVVITDSACNVSDTLSVNLPVADKPSISLSKSNDITCFQGQATLSAEGGSSYSWQPATGLSSSRIKNPVATLAVTTTYSVLVRTPEGCELQDSITVYVNKGDDGSGFPVPSAFTPNGDGKNDCFSVKNWGAVAEFSMNLYNRWGQLVFHADDPSQCWNGVYKGVLQPGDVYVYWIKAKTLCGDINRKGTFALIR